MSLSVNYPRESLTSNIRRKIADRTESIAATPRYHILIHQQVLLHRPCAKPFTFQTNEEKYSPRVCWGLKVMEFAKSDPQLAAQIAVNFWLFQLSCILVMLVPQIVLRDFSFPPIPSLSSGDRGKLLCRKQAENNVRALFTSHRGDFFQVKNQNIELKF